VRKDLHKFVHDDNKGFPGFQLIYRNRAFVGMNNVFWFGKNKPNLGKIPADYDFPVAFTDYIGIDISLDGDLPFEGVSMVNEFFTLQHLWLNAQTEEFHCSRYNPQSTDKPFDFLPYPLAKIRNQRENLHDKLTPLRGEQSLWQSMTNAISKALGLETQVADEDEEELGRGRARPAPARPKPVVQVAKSKPVVSTAKKVVEAQPLEKATNVVKKVLDPINGIDYNTHLGHAMVNLNKPVKYKPWKLEHKLAPGMAAASEADFRFWKTFRKWSKSTGEGIAVGDPANALVLTDTKQDHLWSMAFTTFTAVGVLAIMYGFYHTTQKYQRVPEPMDEEL